MIKKLLLLFIALNLGWVAYAQDFYVKNYNVNVKIDSEGYFDVTEDYDIFFTQSKHGIYRDILLKYDLVTADSTQEKRQIELSNIKVPGHKFEAPGRFGQRFSSSARIKIGDANAYVRGDVHYTIKYRVENAFLHDENGVQFYWNLKPTDWLADFQDMQFTVELPPGAAVTDKDFAIYSGYIGLESFSKDFDFTLSDGSLTAKAKPGFKSKYGEAVTVLIKMPPGAVKEIKPLWPFWTKYGWALIMAALIGGFYMLWRKYGKDDKVPTAISYFPPQDIDPAMAGFLIDDKQDTRDLISLIPYWGYKGYISMTEIDKKGWFAKDDTEIVKLKSIPSGVPTYERELFFGLFKNGADRVVVSTLKDSFYKTMNTCKSLLKKEAQQYYEPRSKRVQLRVTVGLILAIIILAPVVLFFWGLLPAIVVVITGLVLLVLNFFMIKKNTDGNEIFAELKGFRQFIKTAEERKLETLIKESPSYFESTMAYALTFGALGAWAKKFEGLDIKPPDWYHSHSGSFHSMNSFSNSFSKTITSTSSTMVSTPSSSGSGGSSGGSSGGGFGGGGGGSW